LNDTPILRRAVPADAEAIGRLTRLAYAKWALLIGREPLPMQIDYTEAVHRHRFDLLHEANALLALIETVPQGDLLLIVNVAVDPDAQGRGLGKRLLAHAETLALAAGLKGMRLYTNARFEENVRLYASLGYAVERTETLDRGVIVHMVKLLEE
jgi:GNAT superfamily N-acetyltransferase